MHARIMFGLGGLLGLAVLAGSAVGQVRGPTTGQTGAAAQEAKQPTQPSAVAPGIWDHSISRDAGSAGIILDEKQVEIIKRVSAYFNDLVNLKGAFVQTGSDNKRMRGKFYVKRPGRFRFDYALPSKQVIVSDGHLLAIQDHDLNTENVVELTQTPFRLLLRKDVDLLRDARIAEVQEADDLIVLTLQDKSPDTPGRIKLFLAKSPGLELKEWVTTDAQGLDTRIELSNLVKTEDIDQSLFKREFSLQRAQ
jgi:outer membrane lipoprotein-sorting protein